MTKWRLAPLLLLAAACSRPPASAPPGTIVVPQSQEPAPAPSPAPVAAPPAAAGSWSVFHGDLARTGRSRAPALRSPRVRWQAQVGIQGWLNSPLIEGDRVIVPSSGDKQNARDGRDGVFAFSLATGKAAWTARLGNDANGAAIAGDRVIVGSDDGHVYALDLATGKELWKRKRSGKVYANPLPVHDRVVVGDAGGELSALALGDGAELWSVKLAGAIRGGASFDGSHVYAISQEGDAVALDPAGKTAWRVNLRGTADFHEAYAAPIATDTSILVAYARDTYYSDPALVALDKATGNSRWIGKGNGGNWGNVRATPALVNGLLVYAEPYSGDIVGVDAQSGRVSYRKTVGPCFFPQWASPASAGDLVYVPRFDGALYAVRAADGGVAWQLYLGDARHVGPQLPPQLASQKSCEWSVPAGSPLYSPVAIADDGAIAVGSGEGVLYVIEDATRR